MRRLLLCMAMVIGAMAFGPSIEPASACPMCKYAIEHDSQSAAELARPRAYMYSILFMLAMPFTLVAGYSLAFYRVWKKQQEMLQISIDSPDGPGGVLGG